eukprot:2111425-Rhodomonas_salina.1
MAQPIQQQGAAAQPAAAEGGGNEQDHAMHGGGDEDGDGEVVPLLDQVSELLDEAEIEQLCLAKAALWPEEGLPMEYDGLDNDDPFPYRFSREYFEAEENLEVLRGPPPRTGGRIAEGTRLTVARLFGIHVKTPDLLRRFLRDTMHTEDPFLMYKRYETGVESEMDAAGEYAVFLEEEVRRQQNGSLLSALQQQHIPTFLHRSFNEALHGFAVSTTLGMYLDILNTRGKLRTAYKKLHDLELKGGREGAPYRDTLQNLTLWYVQIADMEGQLESNDYPLPSESEELRKELWGLQEVRARVKMDGMRMHVNEKQSQAMLQRFLTVRRKLYTEVDYLSVPRIANHLTAEARAAVRVQDTDHARLLLYKIMLMDTLMALAIRRWVAEAVRPVWAPDFSFITDWRAVAPGGRWQTREDFWDIDEKRDNEAAASLGPVDDEDRETYAAGLAALRRRRQMGTADDWAVEPEQERHENDPVAVILGRLNRAFTANKSEKLWGAKMDLRVVEQI